jgi:hypothetical protein
VLVLRPDAAAFAADGAAGIAGAAAFRGDHFSVRVELDGGWIVEVVDRSGNVPSPGTKVAVALAPAAAAIVPP